MVLTYNDLYLRCRRMLREAGVEDCGLEARLLLCHALGCSKEELTARMKMYAGDAAAEKVRALTERRVAGEPAAYITGSWEFYGLPMIVDRSVLIPRMDTEVLVKTAADALTGVKMNARILDLCCGSGCVGCALGKLLPASRLTLVDVSRDALAVARKNVQLNRLSARAVCLLADALSPPPLRLGNFDLIVCNPPYIPTEELRELDPSVKDWAPAIALDGGEDGLDFYRAVLRDWLSVLLDGGWIMFEVGEEQSLPVQQLMFRAGLGGIGAVRDTAGTERVVYGRKQKQSNKV